MKIIVFAHSAIFGGAEKALRYLIDLLMPNHEIQVVLPNRNGSEALHYLSLGLTCHELDLLPSLPNFANCVLQFARTDFQGVIELLAKQSFDLAISNTMAILHGGIIAHKLGIPHLTYAHEYLDDQELLPCSNSRHFYLNLVQQSSTKIISCSKFVASQFNREPFAKPFILEPYDFSTHTVSRDLANDPEYVIQVIGTQSQRKNPSFAANLVKSLALRGANVRLDIIGSGNSGSAKLNQVLQKRNIKYRLMGQLSNPYESNLHSRVITLICSNTEPYGLTIPESLRMGIPVLSTRSGGPEEILPPQYLFGVGDLDEAVRKSEEIFSNYDSHAKEAIGHYSILQKRISNQVLSEQITELLEDIRSSFVPSSDSTLFDLIESVRLSSQIPLDLDSIGQHIAKVASNHTESEDHKVVLERIDLESKIPGISVLNDINLFDVVPFAESKNMQALYLTGLGLAIELSAHVNDIDRLEMSSFIVCSLHERQKTQKDRLKILVVGDGLGIDSIRLGLAGFRVDYIDYDQSNMSKVAKLNIAKVKELKQLNFEVQVINDPNQEYDAIVCLEVIEDLTNPLQFMLNFHPHLTNDGLLFISECFNGIENKWPTHLHTNEQYAGLLPFMLCGGFEYMGINRQPYAKPYLFKKRPEILENPSFELFFDHLSVRNYILNQLDVGF